MFEPAKQQGSNQNHNQIAKWSQYDNYEQLGILIDL